MCARGTTIILAAGSYRAIPAFNRLTLVFARRYILYTIQDATGEASVPTREIFTATDRLLEAVLETIQARAG